MDSYTTDRTIGDRPIFTFPRAVAIALLCTVAGFAFSSRSATHAPSTDRWSAPIPAGALVHVQNVNGAVRVARAAGSEVSISTTRTARGVRPEPLRLHVEREGDDVRACVVVGDASCGDRTRGTSGFLRRLFGRYSSTSVDFVVALPAGVRVDATTVNGEVVVADASSDVRATTVNGSVVVATSTGGVRANTVNGSVSVRLDGTSLTGPMRLETVNGSVTALLPTATNASLTVRTVNGHIENEFAPVEARTHKVETTLGGGGPEIRISTVNGRVHVGRTQ